MPSLAQSSDACKLVHYFPKLAQGSPQCMQAGPTRGCLEALPGQRGCPQLGRPRCHLAKGTSSSVKANSGAALPLPGHTHTRHFHCRNKHGRKNTRDPSHSITRDIPQHRSVNLLISHIHTWRCSLAVRLAKDGSALALTSSTQYS